MTGSARRRLAPRPCRTVGDGYAPGRVGRDLGGRVVLASLRSFVLLRALRSLLAVHGSERIRGGTPVLAGGCPVGANGGASDELCLARARGTARGTVVRGTLNAGKRRPRGGVSTDETRASLDLGGPRGLWLSHNAQRVDDTIEIGDSARDPVYQPVKGDGANRPSCCRPVELDAMRMARPVRGRLTEVTLLRRVRSRDQSQCSIP